MGLIIWWIVEQIVNNPGTWWQITIDSLATVLTEWSVVLLVFIGLNWWMAPPTIYEPRGNLERKILKRLFKLTPREGPPTPPPAYTPTVHPIPSPSPSCCYSRTSKYKMFWEVSIVLQNWS